jgi:subtilase family serine protease
MSDRSLVRALSCRPLVEPLGRIAVLLATCLWLCIPAQTACAEAWPAPYVALAGNRPAEASSFSVPGLEPDASLELRFSFALRNRGALKQLLRELQDPGSPRYHQWLTPDEFNYRFGATEGDRAAVVRWLESQGLEVMPAAGANSTRAAGRVEAVERALGVSFSRSATARFYANVGAPVLPARIAAVVAGIRGLDNTLRWRAAMRHVAIGSDGGAESIPDAINAGASGFGPSDLRVFYDATDLIASGVDGGGGDCIAVVEDSDFSDAAVRNFNQTFDLPAADLSRVFADSPAGPGLNADETEALLDIEWAHAIAPGAPIVAYIAADLTDAIARAITDNRCGVIEISYAFCGATANLFTSTLDPLFAQAAAQGQSVLVASGDTGATGLELNASLGACVPARRRGVNEMAADPNVTAVGGTMFRARYGADGATTERGLGAEHAWREKSGRAQLGATGGGLSRIFPKPFYQVAKRLVRKSMRAVPDVSLASGVLKPGFFVSVDPMFDGGTAMECCFGGTSLAAAVWAGIAKLVADEQAANGGDSARLGNINPRLYLMAGGLSGFRDVTSGNNGFRGVPGFAASRGYDLATGWGSVDLGVFVPAFVAGDWSAGGTSP